MIQGFGNVNAIHHVVVIAAAVTGRITRVIILLRHCSDDGIMVSWMSSSFIYHITCHDVNHEKCENRLSCIDNEECGGNISDFQVGGGCGAVFKLYLIRIFIPAASAQKIRRAMPTFDFGRRPNYKYRYDMYG